MTVFARYKFADGTYTEVVSSAEANTEGGMTTTISVATKTTPQPLVIEEFVPLLNMKVAPTPIVVSEDFPRIVNDSLSEDIEGEPFVEGVTVPYVTEDTVEEPAVEGVTVPYVVQPLGMSAPVSAAPVPGKVMPAFIRGIYTILFSLLGMAGAAFAYLRDNLNQLTDIKWQTVAVIVVGAVLAGFGYGLKKYYKPDGVL